MAGSIVEISDSSPGVGPDANALPDAGLLAAYRRTRYTAVDGATVATIDAPSPAIDRLLDAHDAASGVFVTAWNPGSARANAAVNRDANVRLAADLSRWRWVPHVGIGDDGWQEEGFFVFDLPEATAVSIAYRYGQVAIVAIDRGGPARLILTGRAPASAQI
jgi:hypothetical protein